MLHVQILSWDPNNFARVTSEQKKKYFRGYISANLKDLVFRRNDFLRLVGARNESLILIIIYYIFKYSVGIKTTLLESLRSQKSILKAIFQQNKLQGLSFCAKWLFKACWCSKWVPNTYYNILYVQIFSWNQNNLAIVTSESKNYFTGYISAKLILLT